MRISERKTHGAWGNRHNIANEVSKYRERQRVNIVGGAGKYREHSEQISRTK